MKTKVSPKPEAQRSAIMRAVKSVNTGPEIKLRKLLHAAGFRYRLHAKGLPGRPDLVLAGKRTVIFVHGCFWHGHRCKRGDRIPKHNAEYWQAKIARNRNRDRKDTSTLKTMGWHVLIVWECSLKQPEAVMLRLEQLLKQRSG